MNYGSTSDDTLLFPIESVEVAKLITDLSNKWTGARRVADLDLFQAYSHRIASSDASVPPKVLPIPAEQLQLADEFDARAKTGIIQCLGGMAGHIQSICKIIYPPHDQWFEDRMKDWHKENDLLPVTFDEKMRQELEKRKGLRSQFQFDFSKQTILCPDPGIPGQQTESTLLTVRIAEAVDRMRPVNDAIDFNQVALLGLKIHEAVSKLTTIPVLTKEFLVDVDREIQALDPMRQRRNPESGTGRGFAPGESDGPHRPRRPLGHVPGRGRGDAVLLFEAVGAGGRGRR
jgi:hypothetical protein